MDVLGEIVLLNGLLIMKIFLDLEFMILGSERLEYFVSF